MTTASTPLARDGSAPVPSEAGGEIRFEGVGKTYPAPRRRSPGGSAATQALRDVSFTVRPGSIFGVIGYSGAGKSTLARTVNGLERPTAGRVLVDGVDVGALRGGALRRAQKRTGMVFQQFNLLETVRVVDNVALPLRLDGVDRARARSRARELLEFVGLGSRADAYAGQLSGGQKQRVGIARALARNPAILLSDEATSALDPTTTGQIIQLLRDVNREYGTTVLVITHEMDVITELADEVAVMADGAVVEQGGVLETFLHPRASITREFASTVFPQGVPERVVSHLGTQGLWRLLLVDEQVVQPLVSDLIHDLGVTVNMLHADMTEIGAHTVGQMIVKVEGDAAQLDAAQRFLTQRVATFSEVTA